MIAYIALIYGGIVALAIVIDAYCNPERARMRRLRREPRLPIARRK